jgi:hypothetical protein
MSSDIIKTSLDAFQIAEEVGILEISGGSPNNWIPDWLEDIGKAIWDVGSQLVGFVASSLGSALQFTFSRAWSIIVQSAQFAWNFNWDVTDQQLDAMLNNLQILIASQLGATAGSLAGYLVCGALPGAVMLKFNKALAVKILKDVGEEALEEFAANLAMVCQTALNGLIQMTFINFYKNARRALKTFFQNPNSPQNQFFSSIFGEGFNSFIAGWGDGKDNYSFANLMEEKIESIPNLALRSFVEEFVEEFADSCIEAGYIVAGGLDDWVATQKLQKTALLGEQKIVELTPNREAPDEKLILAGNEALIKSTLPVVISTHQQIANRDVGMIAGETLRDNITKVKPPLTLVLQWAYYETPPFRRGNRDLRQCEIPNIKRSKLDWNLIKQAMGGANGYMWGRFKAYATLLDSLGNKVSPVKLYAGTAGEAEDRLRALITLTDCEITSFSVTEELREGRKATGRALHKESARIYPAYMTLINSQKIINEANGYTQLTGTYRRQKDRIEMWTTTAPDDFDDRIAELLIIPGPNI